MSNIHRAVLISSAAALVAPGGGTAGSEVYHP